MIQKQFILLIVLLCCIPPAWVQAQQIEITQFSQDGQYIHVQVRIVNGLTLDDANRFQLLIQGEPGVLWVELRLMRDNFMIFDTPLTYQVGNTTLDMIRIQREVELIDPTWIRKWEVTEIPNYANQRLPWRFTYNRENPFANFPLLQSQYFNVSFSFHIPKRNLDLESGDEIYCSARGYYKGNQGGFFDRINFRTSAARSGNILVIR